MGQNLDETKPIKELADKLDEWANRREPKLPEHVGYISFYGSLKKAVGDLPNLVEDLLRSYAREQLNSFQKVLDDLYEKAKAVSHERSKSGGEANILKCQAQAAAASLVKKLRLVEDIIKSRREQIENSKKPAEIKQDIAPAKRLSAWTCIKKALKIFGAIIAFLAALLTIFYYLGWLDRFKAIVDKILLAE